MEGRTTAPKRQSWRLHALQSTWTRRNSLFLPWIMALLALRAGLDLLEPGDLWVLNVLTVLFAGFAAVATTISRLRSAIQVDDHAVRWREFRWQTIPWNEVAALSTVPPKGCIELRTRDERHVLPIALGKPGGTGARREFVDALRLRATDRGIPFDVEVGTDVD